MSIRTKFGFIPSCDSEIFSNKKQWRSSWLWEKVTKPNFGSGPFKEYHSHEWLNLAPCLLKRSK